MFKVRTHYCCGPTPDNPLHIGNFKTFYKSIKDFYSTRKPYDYCMINITDIGESIYNKLSPNFDSKEFFSYTNKEIRKFVSSLRSLNLRPWVLDIVRTSMHIKSIKKDIASLNDKWVSTDKELNYDETGIYPSPYSTLGYLWRSHKVYPVYSIKRAPKGFPGWHIECASLINNYCKGNSVVHYGGADLKNIHHHNEVNILKSLSPELKITWKRTPELLFKSANGQYHKMSKSLNNTIKIYDYLPSHYGFFRDFFDKVAWKTKNYIFKDTFESELANFKFKKPINLENKRYKKIKRYLLTRTKLKNKKMYKTADILRKKIETLSYKLVDVNTPKGVLTHVYEK